MEEKAMVMKQREMICKNPLQDNLLSSKCLPNAYRCFSGQSPGELPHLWGELGSGAVGGPTCLVI